VPAAFTPLKQSLVLNIGGATDSFTLDKNGKGKNTQGSVMLKLKRKRVNKVMVFVGGDVPFTARIQKGAWAATWGFFAANAIEKGSMAMLIDVNLAGIEYASLVTLSYSASPKSGASFKSSGRPTAMTHKAHLERSPARRSRGMRFEEIR
jgi:hypothetical protein